MRKQVLNFELFMRYPNFQHERELKELGYRAIAGVDEAGRGAWAGPVVAAAVVLPADFSIRGIGDSKKITPIKREELYRELIATVDWGVGVVSNIVIDQINILRATRVAMRQALGGLKAAPDFVLVDAVRIGDLPWRQRAVVKGDYQVMSIAAASIIAKVTRDNLLRNLHRQWPNYRFDLHKGYGTKVHQAMIKKYGVSTVHRKTYKPLVKIKNGELV